LAPHADGGEGVLQRLTRAAGALLLATLAAFALWRYQGRTVAVADAPAGMVPCLSYSPFRDGQTPLDDDLVIPAAQIEADLRALAGHTRCVRTYAVRQGLAEVPRIASTLGMTVMLGAWVGAEADRNDKELAGAIELANRYPDTVTAVIVGNEVLLRREQPAERLAALIGRVKAAVDQPVTYADVWEFWLKHPEVASAVDFVTIHTLPFWEDEPVGIDGAVPHVLHIRRTLQDTFPDKRVFIGEAGWPSAGRMREAALPSVVNQARFVRELLAAAAAGNVGVNLIEAFDQPWKRRMEGTVGGHWGLFDSNRQAKFPLTGPVPADPAWPLRFAAASLIAALVVGCAVAFGATLPAAGWLALAVAAQAAAGTLTLAAADAVAAARSVGDWAAQLAPIGLSAAALVLAAAALLRPASGRPAWLPAEHVVAALSTRSCPREGGGAAFALGVVRLALLAGAAATTLALVFDGRYRDFPTFAYLPAAAAVAVLRWRRPGHCAGDRREERLLALVLAAGAAGVALLEGAANHQALAWAATVLLLAAVAASERPPPAET
jgi:glucan 1,3-beta-glucosidase